eukprot:ctg_5357.g610
MALDTASYRPVQIAPRPRQRLPGASGGAGVARHPRSFARAAVLIESGGRRRQCLRWATLTLTHQITVFGAHHGPETPLVQSSAPDLPAGHRRSVARSTWPDLPAPGRFKSALA